MFRRGWTSCRLALYRNDTLSTRTAIGLQTAAPRVVDLYRPSSRPQPERDLWNRMAITPLEPQSDTIRDALARHYRNEGVPDDGWHIGPEHPALERAALEVLETLVGRYVVEIGFQAGGFSVPIIFALHRDPRFRYVGVDNLAYTNSVRPATIEEFLRPRVTPGCYEFVQSDSTRFLKTLAPASVDLVLLDHFKPFYER